MFSQAQLFTGMEEDNNEWAKSVDLHNDLPVTCDPDFEDDMSVTSEPALKDVLPVICQPDLRDDLPVTGKPDLKDVLPVTCEPDLKEDLPVTLTGKPDLESNLGTCDPGCLCNLIEDVPDPLLDVNDIYVDIDQDLFESTLNSGFGLNLECDDDRLYTFPQDVLDEIHEKKSDNNLPFGDLVHILFNQKQMKNARFPCNHCSKTFTRLSLVMDHQYKVHNISGQFKCKLCPYSGNTYHNLKCHINRQHNNKNLTTEAKSKRKHESTKNDDDKAESKKHSLKKRPYTVKAKQKANGKETFNCTQCSRVFNMEKYLRKHEASHLTVFQCPWKDCEKTFRDNYNLQCHIRTHTRQKDIICPHCDYACIQKASLLWHLKKKHPDK